MVTSRGGMRLPAALRRILGMKEGGQLVAEVTADGLLLRPLAPASVEIYDDARIREFDEAEADLASISREGRGS